jgi:hypothetical protein
MTEAWMWPIAIAIESRVIRWQFQEVIFLDEINLVDGPEVPALKLTFDLIDNLF